MFTQVRVCIALNKNSFKEIDCFGPSDKIYFSYVFLLRLKGVAMLKNPFKNTPTKKQRPYN